MRDQKGHAAERRSIVPALIGGALFVAGVAVGVGFRIASANELDDVDAMKAELGPNPCGTGTTHVSECAEIRHGVDGARTDENISTAGFVTAGVALVATAVYWFWPVSSADRSAAPSTSRGRAAIAPVLAPGIAGATLRATF